MKNLGKIVAIILGVGVAIILLLYGTINPCGILKKEIALNMKSQGGEAEVGYVLFGGFVDRTIDTLTPAQCTQMMFKIKTEGFDSAVESIEGF